MPTNLLDMFQPRDAAGQPTDFSSAFADNANSLVGLGMGLLQPYRPGESPWANALQGYQAGSAADSRRNVARAQLQHQLRQEAFQKSQANKEPEAIRTMRAMGIDPTSPEARSLVYPKQDEWKTGSVTHREQEYPYRYNLRTGQYDWGPMGPPPGAGARTPTAPTTSPVVPYAGSGPFSTGTQPPGEGSTMPTAATPPAGATDGGLGEKPPGYDSWLPSEQKAWNLEQIKIKSKQAAAEPEQRAQTLESAGAVMRELDAAIKQTEAYPGMIGGTFGNFMKGIPGSQASDVSKRLDVVKANIAFDKLMALKRASPTGGALGAVSDREMNLLQSSIASLDQAQNPQQLLQAMRNVRTHYTNIISKIQGPSGGQGGSPSSAGSDPLGLR